MDALETHEQNVLRFMCRMHELEAETLSEDAINGLLDEFEDVEEWQRDYRIGNY